MRIDTRIIIEWSLIITVCVSADCTPLTTCDTTATPTQLATHSKKDLTISGEYCNNY